MAVTTQRSKDEFAALVDNSIETAVEPVSIQLCPTSRQRLACQPRAPAR